MSDDTAKIIGCLVAIPLVIGIHALTAYIAMLVWNALLPGLFGAPVLVFWQAWGL